MNNTIPREPGVVHNNMDLAIAEFGSFLDQFGDVVAVEDVADDGESAAGLCGVDRVSDGVGFFYLFVRYVQISVCNGSHWRRYQRLRPWRLRLRRVVLFPRRCLGLRR